MPKHLRQLKLQEISLVDTPANKGARVVMYKRGKPEADASTAKEDGMSEDIAKRLEAAEAQVAELTKRAEEAEAALAKAAEPAPEYVEIDGQRVEKSAVPAPVLDAIQKQADRIAKMEAEAEAVALAKRGESDLPNLSGEALVKGRLLKAAEGIGDEAVAALKAADAAAALASRSIGKSGGYDAGSPMDELNKMAEDYATKNSVTKAVAFAEITKSGRGLELFNKRNEG